MLPGASEGGEIDEQGESERRTRRQRRRRIDSLATSIKSSHIPSQLEPFHSFRSRLLPSRVVRARLPREWLGYRRGRPPVRCAASDSIDFASAVPSSISTISPTIVIVIEHFGCGRCGRPSRSAADSFSSVAPASSAPRRPPPFALPRRRPHACKARILALQGVAEGRDGQVREGATSIIVVREEEISLDDSPPPPILGLVATLSDDEGERIKKKKRKINSLKKEKKKKSESKDFVRFLATLYRTLDRDSLSVHKSLWDSLSLSLFFCCLLFERSLFPSVPFPVLLPFARSFSDYFCSSSLSAFCRRVFNPCCKQQSTTKAGKKKRAGARFASYERNNPSSKSSW